MDSAIRYICVIICITAMLIVAVYLRSVEDCTVYNICNIESERKRLTEQLWQKQLRLETLINPAAISEKIQQDNE